MATPIPSVPTSSSTESVLDTSLDDSFDELMIDNGHGGSEIILVPRSMSTRGGDVAQSVRRVKL